MGLNFYYGLKLKKNISVKMNFIKYEIEYRNKKG